MTKEQYDTYVKFNNMDLSLGDYQISLNSNRPQVFTTRFNDGRVFSIYIHYNYALDNWLMDIALQTEDGEYEPQATGIVLNTGLDLLMPYRYKKLGELYIYSKNSKQYDSPTANDLNSHFVYIWRHS